jgi:hypothetical protein
LTDSASWTTGRLREIERDGKAGSGCFALRNVEDDERVDEEKLPVSPGAGDDIDEDGPGRVEGD